jgi:ribonuclease R
MVIPMLPEILSNDVCSLMEGRSRLAHSFIINFDKKGAMLDWQRADTIIESRAKLSYEDVQEFFDNGISPRVSREIGENLKVARRLAELLTRQRLADGSLDFDLPEAKIILNEKGEVLELGNRVRLESHRLVEEFMLVANRAAALEVFRTGEPLLYRVHDRPDLEKLEAFSSLMRGFGYHFPVSAEMKPKQFGRFLEKVQDKPETEFINELLLRSMQKAVYQQKNIGHFGLAFSHYTHFTSPIRRYPDLLVHRLLRKLRNGKYPAAFAKRIKGIIDHVGTHCSETERTAETAERQAIKIKQVAYMEKHVGDEFAGVISGVMPYGFFVRLDRMGVEGLVRVSTIDDDYYHYDEGRHRVIGRRRGQVYRLGDAVRVGVLQVNKELNEIDLFVKETADSAARSRKGTRKSERSGPSKVRKPKLNDSSKKKKKGQPAKNKTQTKSGVKQRKRK